MIRLGSAASANYIEVFRGLQECFRKQGIEMDWVLYSGYDALVDAFVNREIDIAWNGPLSYVKIRRRLNDPCRNVAMRDVDVGFITHFVARPDSDIITVEDLIGKRFAFGKRSSVEAGVLPYHFLEDSGISPGKDLASYSFYDDRENTSGSDERDVVKQVLAGEYDAGAVSKRTLEVMGEMGELEEGSLRVFWSSPGYSHCCFTAQGDMDEGLANKITQAFMSVDASDPIGKAVLEGENCNSFVPGVLEGWETLEVAAERESLI